MLPLVELAASGRPESLLWEGFAPAWTVVAPLIDLEGEATVTTPHIDSPINLHKTQAGIAHSLHNCGILVSSFGWHMHSDAQIAVSGFSKCDKAVEEVERQSKKDEML